MGDIVWTTFSSGTFLQLVQSDLFLIAAKYGHFSGNGMQFRLYSAHVMEPVVSLTDHE